MLHIGMRVGYHDCEIGFIFIFCYMINVLKVVLKLPYICCFDFMRQRWGNNLGMKSKHCFIYS